MFLLVEQVKAELLQKAILLVALRKTNGTPKCVDVRADLVLYKAHRIIYEMMIGVIPDGFVVDHLDQNPWNNSLGNLCVKPKAMNHRNTKMIATNTTGITGVSWQTMNKGKHTYAVGRVTFEGKELSARFGVHHYGLLPAFKLAFLWRENKLRNSMKNLMLVLLNFMV